MYWNDILIHACIYQYSSRRKPPVGHPHSRQVPVRSLMNQRQLQGIRHSPTTTPSSADDGDPTVTRGNGTSGNAVAIGNGTRHDTNGAAVSGGEVHGEEFVGECDVRCLTFTVENCVIFMCPLGIIVCEHKRQSCS